MRVALVGADYEENLGLEMVAASLREAQHEVEIIPFFEASDVDRVADRVRAARARLVGLAIQFQHRSHDFSLLARHLRAAGYDGHVTAGGQHATLAYAEILANEPALDSIVLREGERTAVDLAFALAHGAPLADVPGLALRDERGAPRCTASRPIAADLDALPLAHRWRAPTRHLGVPFLPISGSRGCWGSCDFCGIKAYYRDAGGRALRLRSVESLASEMAALWHAEGGPTIFCFHDDTLLLPRPADTIDRLERLRERLDGHGVGQIALIGKTRPDCVTAELARALRQLGVIRMFVGIENGSQAGQDHLGRRTRTDDLHRALDAFRQAGIFVCYNLLLFEPEGSLDDVRDNIAFIRRHASIPVNFCRAEPYHGTRLFQRLRERGSLVGSYLGWDYRIDDDRTELLFRVCAAAFRERNYSASGVANRTIGLGYTAQILRCLHGGASQRALRALERVDRLIHDVSNDTADLLEHALRFAAEVELSDREQIERETALLGLRVSAQDRVWLSQVDELTRQIEAVVQAERPRPQRVASVARLRDVAAQIAVAGALATVLPMCGGETGRGGGTDAGKDGPAGTGGVMGDGGAPPGGYGGDGGAPPGGYGGTLGDSGPDGYGGGMSDGGAPPGGYGGTSGMDGSTDATNDVTLDAANDTAVDGSDDAPLVDYWRSTSPRRASRSTDLPLFDPPEIAMSAQPEADAVRVTVSTETPPASLRWEADGLIEGEGSVVLWHPASERDRIRVAVRTAGGVAIATLPAPTS